MIQVYKIVLPGIKSSLIFYRPENPLIIWLLSLRFFSQVMIKYRLIKKTAIIVPENKRLNNLLLFNRLGVNHIYFISFYFLNNNSQK